MRNETDIQNEKISALEARIKQLEQKNAAPCYIAAKIKQLTDNTYFKKTVTSVKNITYPTAKGAMYGLIVGFFIASCLYAIYMHEAAKEENIRNEKRLQREIFCSNPGNHCPTSPFDPATWIKGLEDALDGLASEALGYLLLSFCVAIGTPIAGAAAGLGYGIFSEVFRGINRFDMGIEMPATLSLD